VYFGGVFWRTDVHLLGGDDVHDVVSCHDVGKVGRGMGGWEACFVSSTFGGQKR
jgi:hypothetical protein